MLQDIILDGKAAGVRTCTAAPAGDCGNCEHEGSAAEALRDSDVTRSGRGADSADDGSTNKQTNKQSERQSSQASGFNGCDLDKVVARLPTALVNNHL